jgi:hypothetical protein
MTSSLFQVGHLARLPLGTTYPAVVSHVVQLLARFPDATLTIDATGVGKPVADMFVYAGVNPRLVMITGGTTETRDGNVSSVPHIVLISQLQALLHQGRLRILRALPDAGTLARELSDFRIAFTQSGNMTFNARSGKHDDLLLATALAVWAAQGGGMSNYGIFELYRIKAGGRPNMLHIGLDLGQAHDNTALSIIRRVDDPLPSDYERMPVEETPTQHPQPRAPVTIG